MRKLPLIPLLLAFLCGLCASVAKASEVNGVSLAHLHRRGFGYGSDACRAELKAIAELGGNWVALNDFAYMQSVSRPELKYERDGSMRREDIVQTIRDAHAAGLKVLVKPHIWSREFWNGGKWVGDIQMTGEADWKAWFSNYRDYVLYNAGIAAETNADALCVGVELENTSHRDADWRQLIADVKQVYKGPLTYSAAFMEWKKIGWWDAVDVIGITAYFPVAAGESPTDEAIRAGWTKVYDELIPFSRKVGRRVCFAELGYTPSTTAAAEPWSGNVVGRDDDLQARLYRIALDEAAKREKDVVGVFVWKWFTSRNWRRVEHPDAFAVQDQPKVLEALRAAWKR